MFFFFSFPLCSRSAMATENVFTLLLILLIFPCVSLEGKNLFTEIPECHAKPKERHLLQWLKKVPSIKNGILLHGAVLQEHTVVRMICTFCVPPFSLLEWPPHSLSLCQLVLATSRLLCAQNKMSHFVSFPALPESVTLSCCFSLLF